MNGKCQIHDNLESARATASRGGKLRAAQFTSESQSAARAQVSKQSLQRAGRAGFEKVGGAAWLAEQSEKARLYRIAHPSEPERLLIGILLDALDMDVHYEREAIVGNDSRAVDFMFWEQRCCIEVNGHQSKPSFGEETSRAAKHAEKVRWLAAQGIATFVFDYTADFQGELDRLSEFLLEHQLVT